MNVSTLFIKKTSTIKDALKKLDETGKKILLVTENETLIGILTDGDIRRWILQNGALSEKIELIMNKTPIFVYEGEEVKVEKIMKEKFIEAVPVLNKQDQVLEIIFWNDTLNGKLNYYEKIDNPVIIMAGGKGTRLYPYTKILPKPLIPIGDTPIVERIINRFNEYGCSNFYLTINYKKNMIRSYFDDLERSYEVRYIEENKPLGTGGSLSLLRDKISETFFVSNCDILIEGNYSDMLKYHKKNKNKITIITSIKNYTIPYGILELSEEGTVKNTLEKPEFDFLVNTGMYILEPEVLDLIPNDTFYHITDLVDILLAKDEKVGTYPVSEKSWLDMGQFTEMENMIESLGIK